MDWDLQISYFIFLEYYIVQAVIHLEHTPGSDRHRTELWNVIVTENIKPVFVIPTNGLEKEIWIMANQIKTTHILVY